MTSRLKIFDETTFTMLSRRSFRHPLTTSSVPLVSCREHRHEAGRIVLKIGIEREDVLAGRVLEAAGERRRLPEISAERKDPNAAVACSERFNVSSDPSVDPSSTETTSYV